MRYDYECENCNHAFEINQGIKDEPLKKCPECKKNTLFKVISGGSGILWRGNGKYKNQYYTKREKVEGKFL